MESKEHWISTSGISICRNTAGAVNLPLGSATAARFSGYWTTRESEIKNVVTNKKGETDTWGGRLRLLQRIGDDAEAILTVERHQVKVRDMVKEQTSYGTSTLGFAAATHTQLLPIRVFDRKAQADAGNGHDQTTTNAALRVSWKINDAWSLVSITGHQKFSRDSDKGGRPGGVATIPPEACSVRSPSWAMWTTSHSPKS